MTAQIAQTSDSADFEGHHAASGTAATKTDATSAAFHASDVRQNQQYQQGT